MKALNQTLMGSVQATMISSSAVATVAPRFGVVDLPFLVNTFDKLDRFVRNQELFEPFLAAGEDKGFLAAGVAGYGGHGWATVKSVRSIADAKLTKICAAETPVIQSLYRALGLRPVFMLWPEASTALMRGGIGCVDQPVSISALTRKFKAARYHTQVGYALGLRITVLNKAWVERACRETSGSPSW